MTTDRKPTGRASTIPAGLAYGLLISLTVTVAGAAVLAWLIHREILPEGQTGYGVMVLLLLASWLGAMAARGKTKRLRLAVCLASGGVYFLSLLVMTALFFGAQYSGVGETGLLVFCGAILAAFTGLRRKTGRKPIKLKI